MAKKYLTLEEAATMAGVSSDEIKRLREQGELRGFADRGAWKFREEDIEELARRRQPDSSPDVPMYDEDVDEAGSSVVVAGDDGSVSDQPTIVRNTSDSDVRLMLDDSFTKSSDPNVDLASGSDSDVQLVSDSAAKKPVADDSDSDVKLVGSDSDVQLLPEKEQGASDSDVRLLRQQPALRNTSDSGVRVMPSEGSGIHVDLDEGESVLAEESGELPSAEDSSFALASESGISLESLADSGISLEGSDSAVALQHLADSGISLADDDDDDSITLASESGIALKPDRKDHGRTMPMMATAKHDLDRDDTAMEVPTLDQDSEFELSKEGTSSETNVILFDEDEEEQRPARGKAKAKAAAVDEDDFGAADELEVDEFASDEEELDVFDAADADFEDDFEEGESASDFTPAGGMARMMAPAEADWGTGTFVGLAVATLLMSVCGVVMYDLVRYMWHYGDPNSFNSFLLQSLGGMM
jgi:excisionase family DNA binding protein